MPSIEGHDAAYPKYKLILFSFSCFPYQLCASPPPQLY